MPTSEVPQTNPTESHNQPQELLKKYNDMVDGLKSKKDGLDIKEEELTGGFAEYLLSNQENFNNFKRSVETMDKHNLSRDNKDSLKSLVRFIEDIDHRNSEEMKKDYEEFMKKIQNPKKLNSMKIREIERVKLYLGMPTHKDDALKAYEEMKKIGHSQESYEKNGMKSQDQEFFGKIWDTLENTYSTDDDFIKIDYPDLAQLDSSVAGLKKICGENWDGKNESINIPKAENSIANSETVKSKVIEKNNQRISENETLVKGISIIDKITDKSKFSKQGETLYYKADESTEKVEFNVAKMQDLFKTEIENAVNGLEGLKLIKDEEKGDLITRCNDDIFSKLKSELLASSEVKDETPATPTETGTESQTGTETQNSSLEYSANKDIIKIKDANLKTKIVDLKFCESLDGDDVKFNITEVKNYLSGLTEKSWKELRSQPKLDKETWTIAVQIALNHLNTSSGEYNGKCDVEWVDGIRKQRTIKGVRGFQETWNTNHEDNKLKIDGAPGAKTMAAIVEALGGSSSAETPTETEAPAETPSETPTNPDAPTNPDTPTETSTGTETQTESQTQPVAPTQTETPTATTATETPTATTSGTTGQQQIA